MMERHFSPPSRRRVRAKFDKFPSHLLDLTVAELVLRLSSQRWADFDFFGSFFWGKF